MNKIKQFFSERSLKAVIPPLVALVVALTGVYNIAIDEVELTNALMVIGGVVGSVLTAMFPTGKPPQSDTQEDDKDA